MTSLHGVGDRWLAGEAIPGVAHALHDTVEIVAGAFDGERGTIALLVGLLPEPNYLVSLPGTRAVRLPQSELRGASAS